MSSPERESTPPAAPELAAGDGKSAGRGGFDQDVTKPFERKSTDQVGEDTQPIKTSRGGSGSDEPDMIPNDVARHSTKVVGEPNDGEGLEPTKVSDPANASDPDKTPAPAPLARPEDLARTQEGVVARYFGMTDVGLVREHNEDNFLVADFAAGSRGLDHVEEEATHADLIVKGRGAVFGVCDGMGGAAAGEVASQMAVDTIFEYFSHLEPPRDRDHFARRVVTSIEEAGHRIFSAAKMDRSRRGMGTTATIAGLMDKVLFVGQVGDSRAYILRAGQLTQITKDQSLVNQLIEAGQLTEDEAEAFEHSNIILQALGTTEEVTVDLTFLELRRGDRLMMCSDGLSGLVHQDMIREVLESTSDLNQCCKKLIDMANVGGGHDNITVVCADFGGKGLDAPSAGDQVVYQQYPLPLGVAEDRESLPPREPRMKEGGLKPGADVKRDTPPSAHAEIAHPAHSSSTIRLIAFAVIALLILILVVVALALGLGTSPIIAPEPEAMAPVVPAEPEPPLEEPAQVSVETDIEGELWVNGELYGPLEPTAPLALQLEPGAYRLEARTGTDVLADQLVTVEAGEEVTVPLILPVGTDTTNAPAAVTVRERAGATHGQGSAPVAEARPTPVEDDSPAASTMRESTTMRTDRPGSTSTDRPRPRNNTDLPMTIANNPFD